MTLKNEKIAGKLKVRFNNIREIVASLQDDVTDSVLKTANTGMKYGETYLPELAKKKTDELNRATESKIIRDKDAAIRAVDGEFAVIRNTLRDWLRSPISSETAALLDAYSRFNIKPTFEELVTLQEASKGCYLAERITSHMAQDAGFESDFVPYEYMTQMLDEAQNTAHNAIANYKGRGGTPDSQFQYAADLMQLDICQNPIFAPIAELFNTDVLTVDSRGNEILNSFAECERKLTEVTDTAPTLSQSKSAEIAKLFESCESEDDRIQIVQEAFDRRDVVLTDYLRLYDHSTYAKALARNVETKREKVRESIANRDTAYKETAASFEALREAEQAAV